jgi:hypothetical protein
MLYDLIYMKCPEKVNLHKEKADWYLPVAGRRGE